MFIDFTRTETYAGETPLFETGEPEGSAATPGSSLVRGSKSSTQPEYEWEDWEIDVINDLAYEAAENPEIDENNALESDLPIPEFKTAYADLENDLTKVGQSLVITCEAWKGIEKTDEGAFFTPLDPENATWKAVVHTDTLTQNKPPEHCGDRWTEKLSERGKKTIEASAKYMVKTGRGYRTFLTLTFTPEWRAQIEKWDLMKRDEKNRSTIGKQATAFIKTLQQRHRNGITFPGHYRRAGKQQQGGGYYASGSQFKGRITTATSSTRWTPIKWRKSFTLKGNGQPFQFVWVIENPKNKDGGQNPHIHVLLNWGVKLDQFHAWASVAS